MSTCVTYMYISCSTQVTLEATNYKLFIYDRWLCFFHIQFLFNFPAGKHRLDGGVYFWAQILRDKNFETLILGWLLANQNIWVIHVRKYKSIADESRADENTCLPWNASVHINTQ